MQESNGGPGVPGWRRALVAADAVPRCGAATRRKTSCANPAMANGRCRMHGGRSTGPRTAEGRERCRRANWRHGARSADFVALRKEAMAIRRELKRLIALADMICMERSHGPARPSGRPQAKERATGSDIRCGSQFRCAGRGAPRKVTSDPMHPAPRRVGARRRGEKSGPEIPVPPSRSGPSHTFPSLFCSRRDRLLTYWEPSGVQ